MAKRIYKSKKKLSTVKATYRKWNEWEEGDILIGTYKGSQTDTYDKPNWLIEVEDAQFTDVKLAKKLMPRNGEKTILGLNSTAKVDSAMEQVEVGDMVQVEYKGTSVLPKTHKFAGKDCHDIEIDLIEEDTGDEDEDETEEDEDEEDDEDVDL